MKKITLLFALMAMSFGFSQQVLLEDFETPGALDAGFSGLASSTLVSDPEVGGTRGQVARLEVVAGAGDPWQGANVSLNTNVVLTTDKTIKMDVYSDTAIDILVKVDNGLAGAPPSAREVKHPGGSQWIEMTVSFTVPRDNTTMNANGEYPTIAVFPNWNHPSDPGSFSNPPVDAVVYFDNIYGVPAAAPTCSDGIQNQGETGIDCGGPCATVCETCDDGIMNNGETAIDCGGPNCAPCLMPPTVPAPIAPNRLLEDVKSLFSDTYTPITTFVYSDNGGSNMDTYNTNWCAANTDLVMIGGNATNRVIGLGCEGVDFQGARFDASAFTHFHMDIYTDGPTMDKSFNVKFSNWNNGAAENNAIEFSFVNASTPALPASNPGTWISIDIELDAAMPGLRNDLAQFIISSDLPNVWYDNLYLYKGVALSTNDFSKTSFSVFPNPSQSSWTVKTESINMSSIKVFDVLGKNVLSLSPNATDTVIDGSNLKAGLYFAQIKTESGINSIKLIKK